MRVINKCQIVNGSKVRQSHKEMKRNAELKDYEAYYGKETWNLKQQENSEVKKH